MDKTNYYPIKMEYYDKGAKLIKIANFNYQKQGPYWFAKEVEMTTVLKKSRQFGKNVYAMQEFHASTARG